MTIRTWAEQQAYEVEIRKAWLMQVAAHSTTYGEAASIVDHDRGSVHRLFKAAGVELTPNPTFETTRNKPAEPARLPRIKNAEARAKEAKVMAEICRRKEMLMAEGYSEQVAMRAVAHQMGAG